MTPPSKAAITARFLLSLAGMTFVAWYYTRRVPSDRAALAGMIFGGLLFYSAIAYVLRPKYSKRTAPRSLRQREIRSQLMFLNMCLWPGRFVGTSIVDFVAMLFGKRPDHEQHKVDVTH